MPSFAYKARNDNGKLIEGVVEADNQTTAAKLLSNRGLTPITLKQHKVKADIFEQFTDWQAMNRLNIDDLILFSRQMYSLSKAGVPIIRAIQSLLETTRNQALTSALKNIVQSLEGGKDLSIALSQHSQIFSPLFISIVNVAEATGGLDQGFLQISQYLQREKETQNRIKSALRYPSMVMIAITIAMVIVNIYVIPAFKGIFDKMGAQLPWQTKFLMTVSDFTVTYWLYLLIGSILLAYTSILYIKTPEGRLQKDRFILKIPAVGSIIHRATMERFSRSFAMILSSGVPLIQGISIVANAIGNTYIGSELNKMRIGIEKGDTISRMAKNVGLFPPLVIQMILVGEETGNISDMLLEVADFYESEIDSELKNLTTLVEPLLLVIIGIMVLILALGIFLPMWNLSAAMH